MGNHEVLKITSHVERELIQNSLKKGAPLALIGALGIIISGGLIPLHLLKIWGFPIFILGLVLIGIGLNPYRKLTRLLVKPYELAYDGSSYFFRREGKTLLQIPESSIEKMKYVEKKPLYGLAIFLKESPIEQVKVFDKNFRFGEFQKDSKLRFDGCDIFLPYFTEGDIERLVSD